MLIQHLCIAMFNMWDEVKAGLGEQLINAFERATTTLADPNPPLVPVIAKAAKLGAKRDR